MKRRRKGRGEGKGGEKKEEEKKEEKKRRRKKGGEKMLHWESNPGPFAWKVTTLTVDRPRLLVACTYYTDIYRANLD